MTEESWSAKLKVTKSSSSSGTVGFEYSLDYSGPEVDFEEYERKVFKLRKLAITESNIIELKEVMK
jgi:two-component SAPR family response regulator